MRDNMIISFGVVKFRSKCVANVFVVCLVQQSVTHISSHYAKISDRRVLPLTNQNQVFYSKYKN